MVTEFLIKTGIQIVFADTGTDFTGSPIAPTTAANSLIVGTPDSSYQMDLTSLGAAGGARESAKADVAGSSGSAWAPTWSVDACLEHAATPTDNEVVDFFWAATPSSGAATGNAGGLTGSDAAYTTTDGKLLQMMPLGVLVLKASVINIGHVGIFTPPHRYGILVIKNRSAAAMHTAMDETHIVFTEIVDESQ